VDQSQLKWNYDDPSEWSEIDPAFTLCRAGKRQSPIDIKETSFANLGRIQFKYRAGAREIVNNGHTIQVNMRHGNYIKVSGKRYDLKQFHFHAPSEHTVNGKASDMVAHFVHQASDGEVAVVAMVMESCKYNPTLDKFWIRMPKKAGQKRRLSRRIKVQSLIPRKQDYYFYTGSLTTPPCTEGVKWMVLKRPVEVSADQIKQFTDLFPKSVRPVQPDYLRPVLSKN